MKALVIGGTGPTGPHVISGLQARGYEVSILHRGLHEPKSPPNSDLEHIHADPHFADSLATGLGSRTFDLILGMYGRVTAIADVAVGRCSQLVCVGGVPVYRGLIDPSTSTPSGMAILAKEDSALVDEVLNPPPFAQRIRRAEQAVLAHGQRGDYLSAGVRYPQIYGPRNAFPWEWPVISRILAGRTRIIVPDNGLWIISRCAAKNAAELVLKTTDSLNVANGKYYNAADDDQFTIAQLTELIAAAMGREVELCGVPSDLAPSAFREFLPPGGQPHLLIDNNLAKRDLGYQEVISARAALVESVQWLVEHPVTTETHPAYSTPPNYDFEDKLLAAYNAACQLIKDTVPDTPTQVIHAMPHPKRPSLTGDELGR